MFLCRRFKLNCQSEKWMDNAQLESCFEWRITEILTFM
jgi:hypothetical protein